jgi:microcompartment protein CcmL/EutN
MDQALGMVAVEAGTTAARRVGEVVAARVIARPHPELEGVLPLGPGAE